MVQQPQNMAIFVRGPDNLLVPATPVTLSKMSTDETFSQSSYRKVDNIGFERVTNFSFIVSVVVELQDFFIS